MEKRIRLKLLHHRKQDRLSLVERQISQVVLGHGPTPCERCTSLDLGQKRPTRLEVSLDHRRHLTTSILVVR
jgi:hypothetical protein